MSKPSRRIVLCIGFAMAVAGLCPAIAADDPKALAGGWELSNADRDRTCKISLRTDAVRGGFRLDLDRACAEALPPVRDAEAWTMSNGLVRLVDAGGTILFEFFEVENGIYEAERPGEGLYFLQNLAAAAPAFKTAAQMAGEWSIDRGDGAALCSMTLATAAAAGRPEGELGLRIRPGCQQPVARFNPVAWKADQGELVLIAPNGQTWRFAEEGNHWRRVPESAQMLVMTRR